MVSARRLRSYDVKNTICSENVPNLKKLDFPALEVTGKNYISWAVDVEIHLAAKGLKATIELSQEEGQYTSVQMAVALILITRHMDIALKDQFHFQRTDARTLWLALEERFKHRKDIVLIESRYEWDNLRFSDFESVDEYVSEVYRLKSCFEICGKALSEEQVLEKTYSTMPISATFVLQKYGMLKHMHHSELFKTLRIAEVNGELVMNSELGGVAGGQGGRRRRGRGQGPGALAPTAGNMKRKRA